MYGARADGWGVQFPSELAPYFSHEAFQAGRAYPRGTILIWLSGSESHIAIVLHHDGSNTVQVFEQNADPDGSPCKTANREINNQFHTCTYALVPIIQDTVPAPPPYTIADIPTKTIVLPNGGHLWDITSDPLVEIRQYPAGYQETTAAIATYKGTQFYLVGNMDTSGFNVLECQDYVAPAPASYVPPTGAEPIKLAETYELVTTVPYFPDAPSAFHQRGSGGNLPAGNYFVFSKDSTGMRNLTSNNQKNLEHWVNPVNNILPETTPPVILPTESVNYNAWKLTYQPFPTKQTFLAVRNVVVKDLGTQRPDVLLTRYDPASSLTVGRIGIYGTFTGPDNIKYYRARDPRDEGFEFWYGIPVTDSNGLTVIVKEPTIRPATPAPLPIKQVSKSDKIHLATSYIAEDVSKFIDIIHKQYVQWLKNKKKG